MFEAYKIGIKLSLIDHVSAGLASLSRSFMKTDADAAKLESRILAIQKTALKGVVMTGAGVGMLASLKGPYEEAKKLAQAQADFQTLNLSAADNAQVFGKAATMSHNILGTTITQNIKNIHDLHTAFGDLHHAIEAAELFTKMSLVAKVANGGNDMDGLITAAAKALEHRGGKVVNDRVAFEREANMMTQVMLGTKMRVSPRDYLTASGTGKMAYQLYDPEYLYGNFAGLMSINGGMRSGTAGMTAFSSLIGGHMDNKGKGFMSELGLWEEGVSQKRLKLMREATKGLSKEEMQGLGMLTPTSGGMSDANAELFSARPDVFISSVLVPAIRKRFGMDMSDEQIALLVAKSFNRNTGDFIGTQITMAQKLGKDTDIINKSMSIGQGLQNYMQSPEGAEQAAGAAWKTFLAVFGTVYLPAITDGLLKLAGALDGMAQWVDKNQILVKGLVIAFTALAGALLIGGTINLVIAALDGLGLVLGASGGLVGLLGKAGLAGAAAFAIVEVGRLGLALFDLFSVKNRDGVSLAQGSNARIAGMSAAQRAQFDAMDADFKPKVALPPGGMSATGSGSPFVKLGAPVVNVTVTNKVDERGITSMVTKNQAREANRPGMGAGTYDPTMGAPPVGLSYAR